MSNCLVLNLNRIVFSLIFQSLVKRRQHKFCIVNFVDPWLYEESRASIDGASLSNSLIVVTNKLDRFQSTRLNPTVCHVKVRVSCAKGSTKESFEKILSETKLISSDDNSKVAFNVETDVLLISALFAASKLLLTEQLIDWVGSSCTLIVSVKILKLVNWRKIASKIQIMNEISPINHNIKGKFYFIVILCDGIVIISGINAKHSSKKGGLQYNLYCIKVVPQKISRKKSKFRLTLYDGACHIQYMIYRIKYT